jgi:hypothetical protein
MEEGGGGAGWGSKDTHMRWEGGGGGGWAATEQT